MPEKMRAVLKTKREPGLEMQLVDIPTIKPNELLVKISATSICGSDLHFYRWDDFAKTRLNPPVIVGHEFCGEVVEVGSEVKGYQVGDTVTADSHIACGRCYLCLHGQQHICMNGAIFGNQVNGALAEYIAVPQASAWHIPREWAKELGAILEPLGGSVHGTLIEPITTQSVLILGDGPIALWAAGVARAAGARKVYLSGMVEMRLAIARQMGADVTFNITQPGVDPVKMVLEETDGVGVDVVLEMSGAAPAIEQAFQAVRKGGRITQFGLSPKAITFDFNPMVLREIRWLGVAGRHMWDTWNQMMGLLECGRFDPTPVITHRLPLDRFEEGFQALTTGAREAGKVVLFP